MKYLKRFRVTAFLLIGGLINASLGFVGHSSQQFKPLAIISAANDPKSADADELIARRIVVTGDVQGGYYRSCVRNEVRTVTSSPSISFKPARRECSRYHSENDLLIYIHK